MSILFKRYHVPMILDGTKTQTRRMGRRRWTEGTAQWAKTGFRKDDRFALLWIERVWRERLGDISAADAKAEGGYTPDGYLEAFMAINGPTDLGTELWAVEFETVREARP